MIDLKHEALEQFIAAKSRRRFLSIAAKAAGGGAAAITLYAQSGTTTGPSTGPAAGVLNTTAINVLNYALSLEFLEATFYTQYLGQGGLPSSFTSIAGLIGTVTGNPAAFTVADLSSATVFTGFPSTFGAGVFALLMQIRDHELAHVAALIQAVKNLGGSPVGPCTYTFPVTDVNSFLTTAQMLENAGVAAYDGALNMLNTPALIQTGATIATVEARHAAFLNLVAGGGLTSGNFGGSSAATGSGSTGTGSGSTGSGSSGSGSSGSGSSSGTGSGSTGSGGGSTGTGGSAGSGPAVNGVTVPGVSASPFPNAFDVPLSMAQVIKVAGTLESNCPAAPVQTLVAFSLTPAASTSAPFSAPVTIDLSQSLNGGTGALQFSFSTPGNPLSFCPAGSNGNNTGAPAMCPQTPAVTVSGSKATITFTSTGYYPIQVTATDSNGHSSSQIIILTFQGNDGLTLPAGTPGITLGPQTSA